jgi:hypothetical protein
MSDLFNRPGRIIKKAMTILGSIRSCRTTSSMHAHPKYLPGKERPFGPPVRPFRAGFACGASNIATVLHQKNK